MAPQRTWIKICGIRDAQTAAAAAEAGADAIGLVLAPGSPRTVDRQQAKAIVQALPQGVAPVGLFVDAAADEVRRTAQEVGLTTVQLHGRETPQEVAALAPLRVIKAVGVWAQAGKRALATWRGGPPNLAALLLDAAADDGGPAGGTGQRVDWGVLAQWTAQGALEGLAAVILAGGLTPENVGEAIRRLRPWGVDVSSGVERRRGQKDVGRIRAFCQAVRQADAARL